MQAEAVAKNNSTGITERSYNFGEIDDTDSALKPRKGHRKCNTKVHKKLGTCQF